MSSYIHGPSDDDILNLYYENYDSCVEHVRTVKIFFDEIYPKDKIISKFEFDEAFHDIIYKKEKIRLEKNHKLRVTSTHELFIVEIFTQMEFEEFKKREIKKYKNKVKDYFSDK